MTSNIGANIISQKKLLGFNSEQEETTEKKEVIQELKKELRPEFINRIDEIVVFNKLGKNELEKIIDRLIILLEKRLKEKNIKIKVDNHVKEYILAEDKDINYGARPLRRKIQTLIEDKLAEEILNGNIQENNVVIISYNNGKIEINSEKI